MDYIKYIDGTSGSSGNCHLLAIEELHTVILLDVGVPFKTVFSYLQQIEFTIEKVVVLVTHEHKDHWKKTTYTRIKKEFDDVYLMFYQYPLKGNEGIRFFNQIQDQDIKLFITQHNCSHGETVSSVYRISIIEKIDFQVYERMMYATDIDPTNCEYLAKSDLYHNMDFMMIESNYDDRHFMDLVLSPEKYIAYGYDIGKGFTRHLSKQQTEYIIEQQKPKDFMLIHQSSRFHNYEA